MRFGTIAIVGRSNVGKSTFLNHVLGEPLAIVSPLPQTTRDNVLGVVHRNGAQLAFLLLRAGTVVAAGPVGETLTDDRVSDCFGLPIRIERSGGRYYARA